MQVPLGLVLHFLFPKCPAAHLPTAKAEHTENNFVKTCDLRHFLASYSVRMSSVVPVPASTRNTPVIPRVPDTAEVGILIADRGQVQVVALQSPRDGNLFYFAEVHHGTSPWPTMYYHKLSTSIVSSVGRLSGWESLMIAAKTCKVQTCYSKSTVSRSSNCSDQPPPKLCLALQHFSNLGIAKHQQSQKVVKTFKATSEQPQEPSKEWAGFATSTVGFSAMPESSHGTRHTACVGFAHDAARRSTWNHPCHCHCGAARNPPRGTRLLDQRCAIQSPGCANALASRPTNTYEPSEASNVDTRQHNQVLSIWEIAIVYAKICQAILGWFEWLAYCSSSYLHARAPTISKAIGRVQTQTLPGFAWPCVVTLLQCTLARYMGIAWYCMVLLHSHSIKRAGFVPMPTVACAL